MIVNNINPNKLHDELIANSIIPLLITHDKIDGEITAENSEIIFADNVDMELVQQIIDAHDPTPLPEPLSEIDRLKISQAEQFETILELLGGM